MCEHDDMDEFALKHVKLAKLELLGVDFKRITNPDQ